MSISAEHHKAKLSNSTFVIAVVVVLIVAVLAAFGLLCVSQPSRAAIPAVKIENGHLAAYDMKTASVDFGERHVDVAPKLPSISAKFAVPPAHVDRAK